MFVTKKDPPVFRAEQFNFGGAFLGKDGWPKGVTPSDSQRTLNQIGTVMVSGHRVYVFPRDFLVRDARGDVIDVCSPPVFKMMYRQVKS